MISGHRTISSRGRAVHSPLPGGLLLTWIVLAFCSLILAVVAIGVASRSEGPDLAAGGQESPVGMVLVPAGGFVMGSQTFYEDESPAHTVRLDAFHIDRHEVTNAWFCSPNYCGAYSTHYRGASPPAHAFNNVGFRCVRDIPAGRS